MDDNRLSPSQAADKFIVRLPDGMRQRIAEVAKRSRRSMNSEIVCRLEHSLNTVADPIAAEQIKNMVSSLRTDIQQGEINLDAEVEEENVALRKTELLLIELFRKLSADEKNALLVLLGRSL